MIKITETPRDGWQALSYIIPVEKKVKYINKLLKVNFDIIEIGSLVSRKAVPQLADTEELINSIDDKNNTALMLLVADEKGGDKAVKFDKIDYLSYPFSISETFLMKNLKTNFISAKETLIYLNNLCIRNNKELIAYIAMAFGNPYNDPWSIDFLYETVEFIYKQGITKIRLTDVTGIATPELIGNVFNTLISDFNNIDFGVHLHTNRNDAYKKIDAAFKNGCINFDTVLSGLGGCPFTGKELTGNLDTFDLLDYCQKNNINHNILHERLLEADEQLSGILI
ncbi:MAG: hydroxymethylglutaryl-CoA lyase [Marinilabiliales bacterium]